MPVRESGNQAHVFSCISVRNLKPKLNPFVKSKLKPKFFLLNWVPARLRGLRRPRRRTLPGPLLHGGQPPPAPELLLPAAGGAPVSAATLQHLGDVVPRGPENLSEYVYKISLKLND